MIVTTPHPVAHKLPPRICMQCSKTNHASHGFMPESLPWHRPAACRKRPALRPALCRLHALMPWAPGSVFRAALSPAVLSSEPDHAGYMSVRQRQGG